jgi:hypothetical protein
MWMLLSIVPWNIATRSVIQTSLEIPGISRIVVWLAILRHSLFANIGSSSILLRWTYQRTGGLRVIVGVGHDTIDLGEVALRTRHMICIHHMRRTTMVVERLCRLFHHTLMVLTLLLSNPLILRDTLPNFAFRVKIGASLLLFLVKDVLVW